MYGFLAINKPTGLSSANLSNRVRNSFSKHCTAGHAGTLDPLASGVLTVAINAATHFLRYLRQDKIYRVDLRLGVSTTTYDMEGKLVAERMVPLDFAQRLRDDVLPVFSGMVAQVPPAYSALKYKGKPLYAYARAGVSVPLSTKKRSVMFHSLRMLRHDPTGMVTLEVGCGPGTYMRSLVHDIGEMLGCGATMTGLTRLEANGIQLNKCVLLPVSQRYITDELIGFLRDPGDLLMHITKLVVPPKCLRDLVHGKLISTHDVVAGTVRIIDTSGKFHGIGKVANNILRVERLLPHSAQAIEIVA